MTDFQAAPPALAKKLEGRAHAKGPALGRPDTPRGSSVGLPVALRVWVDNEICSGLCVPTCPKKSNAGKCQYGPITEKLFSHETWRKDIEKRQNEFPQARGVREGGHFIYLIRKCRELPDIDHRLSRLSSLRNLPHYGGVPPPGELISPFDKFVLDKMRPLRKALQKDAQEAAAADPSSIKRRPRAATGDDTSTHTHRSLSQSGGSASSDSRILALAAASGAVPPLWLPASTTTPGPPSPRRQRALRRGSLPRIPILRWLSSSTRMWLTTAQ